MTTSMASSVAGSAAGSTRRGVTTSDGSTGDAERPGREPGPFEHLRRTPPVKLLDVDRGTGLGELGLGSLCGFLGGLLEDGLGSAVDEILGFLQTEAGQLAHDLDDLDLLGAGLGEDDVELVLLLFHRGCGGCAATGGRDGYRGCGGDAELLFERVEQFLELDHGHT